MKRARSTIALAAFLALLATFIAYAPVRRAGFLQDDHPIVEINPIVHRGDWGEIFRTDYWGGVGGSETNLYRPVTIASFALERGPDGLVDPARAHLINVVLHALASAALGLLALRLGAGLPAAASAGALFALHPIHVSVVAGLVGRAEILATFFTILALLLQSAAGPWDGSGARPGVERLAAWGAALSVFLALGSKEVAFAAPVLLVAFELLFRPPPRVGRARWGIDRAAALAPAALSVTLFLVLRIRALGVFPGTQRPRVSENPLAALDGIDLWSSALGIAGRAFRLLFVPYPLSADYSGNVIRSYSSPWSALPLLGLAGLLGLGFLALLPLWRPRSADRARRSFAACLFLLPYLAVGNLFVLVGIAFAERLVYLPSAGFCLLVGLVAGAVAARGPRARRAATAAVIVLACVYAAGTRAAVADWTSVESIFEAAVRATPESPRATFTLGKIRLDQRRIDEALDLFDRTIASWPRFSAAWLEKGTIEASRGDREGAARSLYQAVRTNPWLDEGWRRLGDVLFDLGRPAEAAAAYERAVRLGRSELAPRLLESRRLAAQAPPPRR